MPDYSSLLGGEPIKPINPSNSSMEDLINAGITQSPIQAQSLSDLPTGFLSQTKVLPNVTIVSKKKKKDKTLFILLVFYAIIFYLILKTIK